MIVPAFTLSRLVWHLRDAMSRADESRPMPDTDEACEPGEQEACALERRPGSGAANSDLGRRIFPVEDLEREAEQTVYRHNGINKRHRYRRVDLSKRYVLIVLHQVGAEKSSRNRRWHHVTAHRVIKPDGTRVRLHPLNVRLTAANRLDRAPFHAISIEVGGNFERTDGAGDWWNPAVMGRGRASDTQIAATKQEIRSVCAEVHVEYGADVLAVAPHIVSGRDPLKEACPGSRVWSLCGEWAGATLGLAVPGYGCTFGGLPIPDEWHGPYWERCDRVLPKGWWPR